MTKTVMIATPMYGGMCAGMYVQGLLTTMSKLSSMGIAGQWVQMSNESLITRARNELARVFLTSEADYLLFVDADIGFDGNCVAALVEADEDVVCGIYPKKEVDWKQVEAAAKRGEKDLSDFAGAFVLNLTGEANAETNDKGLIEVRHGGTGFMLIKRKVFEELAPHVHTYRVSSYVDPTTGEHQQPLTHEFFATSIDHTGALLSEDYHFCELWRSHGGKIYANPFLKLYHVGTYIYTGNIVRAGGNLK